MKLTHSAAHWISAASLWLIAGTAAAQVNPELGDTSTTTQTTTTSSTTTPVVTTTDSTTTTTVDTDSDIPNRYPDTDHGSVVGHFGVGFFGILSIPTAGLEDDGDIGLNSTVLAPTIGVRYWLQDSLGIEVGLGIGISSSGTTNENGTTTVEANGPSTFALGLHGGVPLVFAASKHFAFEVVPELNVAFATGGIDDDEDVDLSGFLLEIGGRVGAEIQFGFIDIPQLALQASVGLHLRYAGTSISAGDNENSSHTFRFGTTVQGEPWDIFGGNLSAIYYF